MASSFPQPSMIPAAMAMATSRGSSSSSSSSSTSIEDLSDELMVEILHRLPNCNTAVECKRVSKRWYSLISLPYFVFRFLSKPNLSSSLLILSEITTIDTIDGETQKKLWMDFVPADPNMIINNFYTFNFLPCYSRSRLIPPISLISTYNNYLLCCSSSHRDPQPVYYICNSLTLQWLALPKPPRPLKEALLGLICQPCYNNNSTANEQDSSFSYKFIVIRVPHPNNYDDDITSVDIFSSESGQWSESVVPGVGFRLSPFFTEAVAYNGALHWLLAKQRGIVGFNISCHSSGTVVDSCHYIPLPPAVAEQVPIADMEKNKIMIVIGVSQGCLRMSVLRDLNYTIELSVWELKDYNGGEWLVVHNVSLDKMISDYSRFADSFLNWPGRKPIGVLGFHPNDGDIVYLRFCQSLLLCDMQRRKLKLVTDRNLCFVQGIRCFFQLVIPWWSTPVPTLPGTQSERLAPIPTHPGRWSVVRELKAFRNRHFLARRKHQLSRFEEQRRF